MAALAKRDPKLGAAMRRMPTFPGFPDGPRATHFEALARAIVYQQLSGKAAATIFGRVCALTPGAKLPRASELLELSEKELRGAGLSNAKFLALRDLSARVASGELHLPSLSRKSDEGVIERLIPVRGIGVWSAQMFLIFRLGRLDVLPTGDLGIQEGLRRLDGLSERPRPANVEERGAIWSPLSSVAAWTLWRLADELA